MTWKDINLEQYVAMCQLRDGDDQNIMDQLITIIFGKKMNEITIGEYAAYTQELGFLNDKIPHTKLCDKYTINDHTYNFDFNTIGMSAAQFLDFQTYASQTPDDIASLLSVFFVPENHSYNDGYSLAQVKKDILQLRLVDAIAISQFFFHFLKKLQTILKIFLRRQKKIMTPEEMKRIEELMAVMDSVFYRSFSNTVN